jgi:hypothetical protein
VRLGVDGADDADAAGVSVSATDNLDPTPLCTITNVSTREDMDSLPARRIAIYTACPDSLLAGNQLAAIQRYACAMGWATVAIVESDEQRLLDLASTHALDLVVCWRTSDLRAGESLVQQLSIYSVELVAVAQSCTSLME